MINLILMNGLPITDKLITDYSSLAVEELVLDIPIYFYIYEI